MRILLLTHYFPPETGAPQARLSEIAAAWASAGDDVTVLTGLPNHPTGEVPPEYRRRLFIRRQRDRLPYRVVRTWLYATPNEGVVKKSLGHLSFMVTSALLGPVVTGSTDVVVVSSPTFFSIFSGLFLAKVKRARLVIEVRDLWPAIFVELGILTNRPLIRVLERIELACYDAADEVVVVTAGFRDDLVRRGVPPGKVTVVRNGVDLEQFDADRVANPDDREFLGATPDQTLVLYIGAHGVSHGLTSVADAAALCHDDEVNVHVAFVGEGAHKQALEAHVAQENIPNVTLLGGVPRERVASLLAAADVCLVPLRDIPLFDTFIPSKMFEYLGAGKAVIGSVAGEAATLLGKAGATVVAPEDPDALASAIIDLARDPKRRQAMGAAGRRFVEANFDRRALAESYREVLQRALTRSS